MRFYVVCHDHPDEKIYLKFEGDAPEVRGDISFDSFTVACPASGNRSVYSVSEVMAEEGATLPVAGSAVGALLFLFTPIAGLVGTIAGLFGGVAKERDRVKTFNESRIQ